MTNQDLVHKYCAENGLNLLISISPNLTGTKEFMIEIHPGVSYDFWENPIFTTNKGYRFEDRKQMWAEAAKWVTSR